MTNKEGKKSAGVGWMIIGIVLLIVFCLYGVMSQGAHKSAHAPSYSTTQKPLKRKQVSTKTNIDFVVLSEKLRDIVLSHPETDIRIDFHRLVQTGVIGLDFQENETFDAFFVVARNSKRPAMLFDVNKFFHADKEMQHLILSHEYVHFKQWASTDDSSRKRIFEQMSESEVDAEACRNLWEAEHAAYSTECILAKKWEANTKGDMCEYVDNQEVFAQVLMKRMKEAGAKVPVYQKCVPVWDTLLSS